MKSKDLLAAFGQLGSLSEEVVKLRKEKEQLLPATRAVQRLQQEIFPLLETEPEGKTGQGDGIQILKDVLLRYQRQAADLRKAGQGNGALDTAELDGVRSH